MPHAEIHGRSVEYVRTGTGNPVVFSSPTWWPLDAWHVNGIGELSTSYEVVAFNHRGIGATGASSAPYTVRSLGDDLIALADALGLARIHIVGYAIGAAVALAAARFHSDRVSSLTLAAPSIGLPRDSPSPIDHVRRELAAESFEHHVRAHLTTTAHPAFEHEQPARFSALSDAMWKNVGTVDNFLKHVGARGNYDAMELARGLDVPSLVLVGADDAAARGGPSPVDAARMIAKQLPHARFHLVERAGHMPLWEVPSAWEPIRAFLQEVDR